MRIGFDVDGVLADFNRSFMDLFPRVTGKSLFAPDYWPHTWDYPQAVGYTNEETSAVWEHIKAGGAFWGNLEPLPDMDVLRKWMASDPIPSPFYEIYYVTSRMGRNVKFQTETWLDDCLGNIGNTVLISSEKGAIAKALKLDYYVDDRAENILDVMKVSPGTHAFLLDAPWNQHINVALRIRTLAEFLNRIDAHTAHNSKQAA